MSQYMLQRVLVADDSEPVQKAIQIALEPYDVEIFEASSFVEALNICKKKSPNLIIADASLTGTDAPKEFKIMSNTAGEVPVLLLEGSFEPIDKEGFEAMGMECFLKKPFNIKEIERVLKEQMQFVLPIKGQGQAAENAEEVPPPPPMAGQANSSWESQLEDSGLQLDISLGLESDNPSSSSDPGELPSPNLESGPGLDLDAGSDLDVGSDFDAGLGFEAGADFDPGANADPSPNLDGSPSHLVGDSHLASILPDEPASSSQTPAQKVEEATSLGVDLEPSSVFMQSLLPVLQKEILPLLKKEVEERVKQSVKEYCELNFKRLAREVIKEELRSLVSD